MFSKISIRRDVQHIRALLTAADPAGGPLAASSAARLAALRHRIDVAGPGSGARAAVIARAATAGARATQPPPATRTRRAWWPNGAKHQRRNKIVIACVAAPALAAATAAGWVIANNGPASHVVDNVWCFTSPHGGGSVSLPATGQAPTALCAQQWASGNVNSSVHTVPPLVACSMGSFDGGSVAVYPDTTCHALHLRPLPTGYQQASRSFAALTGALEADGLYATGTQTNPPPPRCLSSAKAIALTEQALQANGFTGWRLVVRSSPKDGCANALPDSASHTVLILMTP